MQDLKVSLIQTSLDWNSPESNLLKLAEKISQIEGSDLILLSEMFTTGFSVSEEGSAVGKEHQENTLSWLKQRAAERQCVVAGSIIWCEQDKFFNRMIWMKPNGDFETYDKRHVFSYAGEGEVFSGGAERKIFELNGWRILPQICYDLRFPVFARNTGDYDLYLNVASWPEVRRDAWRTLLKARAIENQCYAIGVNRVGPDPNVNHSGDSLVFDPTGGLLLDCEDKDDVFSVSLSFEELSTFRDKFPFLNDADSFTLR